MRSWRSVKIPLIILCSFALGGAAVWFVQDYLAFFHKAKPLRGTILRLDSNDYHFINPLIACDVGPEEAFPEFNSLKNKLDDIIQQEKNRGAVKEVSVYVRTLKSGRWFQINGDAPYDPASMLKIFIMMAYYKEAEDNPMVLQKSIVFQGSANPDDGTPGEVIPHLANGKNYTVDQLIDQMIIYSDNDAANNLIYNLDSGTYQSLENIYSDLNIPAPPIQDKTKLNYMPVTNYAMAFRVLFSATYLGRSNSEKALKLLSKAHYKGGLTAGVPSDIPVAHKFGIRKVLNASGVLPMAELHDCGIVYYPNHPYLLCVMTAGSDFNFLQKTIQNISSAAYAAFDNLYSYLPAISPMPANHAP